MAEQVTPPVCPYCSRPSIFLANSTVIYGRDYGAVYVCSGGCDAYVGVHEGTRMPKGTLANKPLREARKAVHRLFDPTWQDLTPAYPDMVHAPSRVRQTARMRAYKWLAHQLVIEFDACHVAMFDLQLCLRALDILRTHAPTSAVIRDWAKSTQRSVA